jgi:hypothetical protein
VILIRKVVASSSQTSPHIEEQAPFQKSWEEKKNGHGVPTGLETKNYCAGESQQRFNRQTHHLYL